MPGPPVHGGDRGAAASVTGSASAIGIRVAARAVSGVNLDASGAPWYFSNMFRKGGAGGTLLAVAVVQFLVSLDLSVVNVGLPEIAVGLDFSRAGLTWVVHAYALTFGGLLLLGGKIADRYGHRSTALAGLAVFAAASLAGGFAQSAGQLVVARGVQGVGAAALAPAALALLTATYPSGAPRAKAFGVWSAMNAAGGALGVLAGGLLTQYAGWRWVMFVNVPMAMVAVVLLVRGVPRDRVRRRTRPADVTGAVLATAGLFVLVFAVVRTEVHGWASPATLGTLVVAAVLLVLFVGVERRTGRDPLFRLGLLAQRSVAGANLYNLLLGGAMASAFYFTSLYCQRVLGHGPALTGLEILPFALGVVLGSVLAVRLGGVLGRRQLLIVGALVTATGFAWFGLISPDGGFVTDILGPSLVASIGFGLCLGPVVSTATAGVAAHEVGMASGLLNSARQVGASLGLAALGTLAATRTGDLSTPEALNAGYSRGFLGAAALLLGAAAVAALVLPRSVEEPRALADEEAVGE